MHADADEGTNELATYVMPMSRGCLADRCPLELPQSTMVVGGNTERDQGKTAFYAITYRQSCTRTSAVEHRTTFLESAIMSNSRRRLSGARR